MELFLVGGAVRDMVMGRQSKDWDFTVVGPKDFATMRAALALQGFEEFLADEQHGTVRARAPKGWTFAGLKPPVNTFDFVLSRKDVETDGRRAITAVGTLEDDLARRDFTMNAIAMDSDGAFIDPHDGIGDIERRVISTVGMPKQRFREDGLRVLRAIRFAIVLGFDFHGVLAIELSMRGSHWLNAGDVSVERIREELFKAFRADTVRTFRLLEEFRMTDVFDGKLWLKPTLEQ